MAQTDFTPASHLQRDNAELIAACAVPLVERLARIPRDAILRWTDEDELQASHSVPIGLLAHEAASRLESLSPQPPAETGDDDAELRIVFDGPPSHESGRFVECETADGRSVNAGQWHERPDGLWELRIASRLSVSTGEAPSPQPDTDVVERVAPPMYADCDTYVAGQYVFNYLRAFLAAAGIDASLCKLVIELPDRDVQRQLVGVLQKDAKGPPRSAARIGNHSGTWQGVEYEFSIKGATAALNASTPEIQRMREALNWAETYDPQMVAQIRDRAALKQDEENHDK